MRILELLRTHMIKVVGNFEAYAKNKFMTADLSEDSVPKAN